MNARVRDERPERIRGSSSFIIYVSHAFSVEPHAAIVVPPPSQAYVVLLKRSVRYACLLYIMSRRNNV